MPTSAWQFILHLALDSIRTDSDFGNAAFGDQLFELAEGNGVNLVVTYPATIPG